VPHVVHGGAFISPTAEAWLRSEPFVFTLNNCGEIVPRRSLLHQTKQVGGKIGDLLPNCSDRHVLLQMTPIART
jgi:hypothetical protein